MQGTIMMIGGGIESLPGISEATALGLDVFCTDSDASAPGLEQAAHEACVSTYDIEGTLREAEKWERFNGPLCGVFSLGCDVPMTVAAVANARGLVSISNEAARIAANKILQREAGRGMGRAHMAPAVDLTDPDYPIIVKPPDGRGSRGVSVVTEPAGLTTAWHRAIESSTSGVAIAEQIVHGQQISVEGMVVGDDHTARIVGISDRNYSRWGQFAPYIIEDGGDMPADLTDPARRLIAMRFEDHARAMGLTTGPVKADMIATADDVIIVEMHARLSGGHFAAFQIPAATGVNLVSLAIRQCVGDRLTRADLAPSCNTHVCQRYLFPGKLGEILAIRGVADLDSWRGLLLVDIRARAGQRVTEVRSHSDRLGCVMATGATRNAAQEAAEAAIENIELVMG